MRAAPGAIRAARRDSRAPCNRAAPRPPSPTPRADARRDSAAALSTGIPAAASRMAASRRPRSQLTLAASTCCSACARWYGRLSGSRASSLSSIPMPGETSDAQFLAFVPGQSARDPPIDDQAKRSGIATECLWDLRRPGGRAISEPLPRCPYEILRRNGPNAPNCFRDPEERWSGYCARRRIGGAGPVIWPIALTACRKYGVAPAGSCNSSMEPAML